MDNNLIKEILNKPAIIKIPYPDEPKPGDGWIDNTFPKIKEESLKVYLFDNDNWIPLEFEVKPELNIVIAKVPHFSNITLAGSVTIPPPNLVIVYPNPFNKERHEYITFLSEILTSGATLVYKATKSLMSKV